MALENLVYSESIIYFLGISFILLKYKVNYTFDLWKLLRDTIFLIIVYILGFIYLFFTKSSLVIAILIIVTFTIFLIWNFTQTYIINKLNSLINLDFFNYEFLTDRIFHNSKRNLNTVKLLNQEKYIEKANQILIDNNYNLISKIKENLDNEVKFTKKEGSIFKFCLAIKILTLANKLKKKDQLNALKNNRVLNAYNIDYKFKKENILKSRTKTFNFKYNNENLDNNLKNRGVKNSEIEVLNDSYEKEIENNLSKSEDLLNDNVKESNLNKFGRIFFNILFLPIFIILLVFEFLIIYKQKNSICNLLTYLFIYFFIFLGLIFIIIIINILVVGKILKYNYYFIMFYNSVFISLPFLIYIYKNKKYLDKKFNFFNIYNKISWFKLNINFIIFWVFSLYDNNINKINISVYVNMGLLSLFSLFNFVGILINNKEMSYKTGKPMIFIYILCVCSLFLNTLNN